LQQTFGTRLVGSLPWHQRPIQRWKIYPSQEWLLVIIIRQWRHFENVGKYSHFRHFNPYSFQIIVISWQSQNVYRNFPMGMGNSDQNFSSLRWDEDYMVY
jgi:hypothetical protein